MPPPRRPRERLIALTQPTGAPVSAYGDTRRYTRMRERLQTNGAAIVVATVFALLCALLLFDDPGRAPTLTIDNPTAFDVRVEVSDANRAEWTVLTSARQQCGAAVEAPIDRGRDMGVPAADAGAGVRGDRDGPRRSRAGELALRHPRCRRPTVGGGRRSASAPAELLNRGSRDRVTHGTTAPRSIHATIVFDVQHRGRARPS